MQEAIARIRQLQGPDAANAAEGLLVLLDRSPWMRREISLKDLAFLQGLTQQKYSAEGRALAEWHAGTLNLFLDAGLGVSTEDMDAITAELKDGWRVCYQRGEWRAEEGEGLVVRYAAEDWQHQPGLRSQRKWVNSKTGKVVYSDANPGGGKQPKGAEGAAPAGGEAAPTLAALARHHGELVKERVEKMATGLRQAAKKSPEMAAQAKAKLEKLAEIQPDLEWDNIPEALPVEEEKPYLLGRPARDMARQQLAETTPNLSDEEKAAIHHYTGVSAYRLNGLMRSVGGDASKLSPADREHAERIQSAIDKAPPLPKPILAIRSMNLLGDDKDRFVAGMQAALDGNAVFSLPSFTSTSLSATRVGGSGVRIRIAARTGLYVENLSEHPEEEEFLQSPKVRYRVTAIEQVTGIPLIHLEEVDNGQVHGGQGGGGGDPEGHPSGIAETQRE